MRSSRSSRSDRSRTGGLFHVPLGNTFQHAWSLAIEEQLYIVWAVVMALCLARLSIPRVAGIIALLLLAACSLCAALWIRDIYWFRIYAGSDTRAFELLAGALLAALYSRHTVRETLKSHPVVISVFAIAALGTLPLIACFAPAAAEGKFFGVRLLIVAATVSVIIDVSANPDGLVAAALSCRLLVYIGSISDGIYLWHDPLSWIVNEYGSPPSIRILVVAGGGVLLAATSYAMWNVRHSR